MTGSSPGARRDELVEVLQEASACTRCALHESRTKVVFGAGDADADLMFVGEAPGAEEDKTGLPFVGRAGKLLDEMLDGIGLERADTFIANVLKCRPPGNRDPERDEIESCRPYLERQVALVQPKVLATLGNFATKLLTGNPTGITRVHGEPQPHSIGGLELVVLPLFHPAAALRATKVKDLLRDDFARIPALISDSASQRSTGAAAVDASDSAGQLGLLGGGSE